MNRQKTAWIVFLVVSLQGPSVFGGNGARVGWLQAGMYFDADGPPFYGEVSGHVRRAAHLYSAGIDVIGWEESDLTTWWLAYGRSANSPHFTLSVSGGLSLCRYKYSACDGTPGGEKPLQPGAILKFESLLHFKHFLGAGAVVTWNWNEVTSRRYESPMSFKFVLAVGNWD